MSVRPHRLLGAAVSVAVLAAVAVATFVGVTLVAGGDGGDEATLDEVRQNTPHPSLFPEPPSGPVPTDNPDRPAITDPTPRPTEAGPESVEVAGVVIPIPEGAHYSYFGSPGDRATHHIWYGESMSRETESGLVFAGIEFDESGLLYADFPGFDGEEFGPTLDALWMLTRQVATPSPQSLAIKSAEIALPAGSYYSTIEAPPALADSLVRYFVRSEHSVVSFDLLDGERVNLVRWSVEPGSESKFQLTLDSIEALAVADQ